MLRHTKFNFGVSTPQELLLSAIRSNPKKRLTRQIFAAVLECPKQGLMELAHDFEKQQENEKAKLVREKAGWNVQSSSSSSPSSLFRLDLPPRGFPSPHYNVANNNIIHDRQHHLSLTKDIIPAIQKNHLMEYARKWHRQRFPDDRVFMVNNNASSCRNLSFNQECEQTKQIIDEHLRSSTATTSQQPLAIHNAAFKTKIDLPQRSSNNNNSKSDDFIEAHIRCDLLHFVPPKQYFLGNHLQKRSIGSQQLSQHLAQGSWELIQVKSQIEPDRDAPVHLRHLRELAFHRYVLAKNGISNLHSAAILHPSRTHRRESHTANFQTCHLKGLLNQFFGLVNVNLMMPPMPAADDVGNSALGIDSSSSSPLLFDRDIIDNNMEEKLIVDRICQLFFDTKGLETVQERKEKESWLRNYQSGSLDDENDKSLAGSHCQWSCRFYKQSSCPCFPSSTTTTDSIFNLPRMNLNKKSELWNRGVKLASSTLGTLSNGNCNSKDLIVKKIEEVLKQQSQRATQNKTSKIVQIGMPIKDTIPWSDALSSALAADVAPSAASHLPKLTSPQLRFAISCATRLPVVDRKKVDDFINKIKYPLIALDFEASQFAVPPFADYNTYDHLPFQFSAHVVLNEKELLTMKDGVDPRRQQRELLHREFLHVPTCVDSCVKLEDPRPHVAQKLRELFDEFSSTAVSPPPPQQQQQQESQNEKSDNGRKKSKPKAKSMTKREASQERAQDSQQQQPQQEATLKFQGSLVCHNAAFESRVISRLCSQYPTILAPARFDPKRVKACELHFLDTVDLVSSGVTRFEAGGSASMKKQLPLFAQDESIRRAYQPRSSSMKSTTTANSNSNNNQANYNTTNNNNNNNDGGEDNNDDQLIVDGLSASYIYWMLVNGYRVSSQEQLDKLTKDMLRYCAADSLGTIELIRGCAKYVR